MVYAIYYFFFKDTATTESYTYLHTPSLHDALPISARPVERASALVCAWAVRMTGYAELAAATNFSFLRGASQPADMVAQALSLGLQGIGIADRNTVAGVVRAHVALRKARAHAKEAGLPAFDFSFVTGARLEFAASTPAINH